MVRRVFTRVVRLLARETSSGQFIPQLDGLRFAAVAAVVLYHVDAVVAAARPQLDLHELALHHVLSKGYVGVQLFFAISGFVLALPFATHHLSAAKPVRLRAYYVRRLTRLEPTYLINLVIMWVAKATVKGFSLVDSVPHLIASMFYVHYPVYGTASTVNAVAWSLEIEVQFYVLAPLLTLLFALRPTIIRRSVMLVAIVGIATALALRGPLDNHAFTLLEQLHYFLIGFLLVDLHLVDWRDAPRMPGLWDAGATLAWVAIPLAMVLAPTAAHFVVPAAIFCAYAGALRGRAWPAILATPWLFTIGGMCYTIYLYNNQLLTTFVHFTMRLVPRGASYELTVAIQVLTAVPLVIATSAVLFVLFEKPFMRRGWPAAWMRMLVNARRPRGV
jgi:peptidoglycan/LPS O-acetylase OafA/YrhL